ncbi:MAG TPA: DoxX family protein [Bryobacteraceae bacterium]|nr:DoxX family protein [Bryobacteraceae bacterium]
MKPALWNQALHEMPWLSAVPQDLCIFIGICEFLGGVGPILPAIAGVEPKLAPIAAIGLTLVMILAAVFHIVRGEYNFFPPMWCCEMWCCEGSPRSSRMDCCLRGRFRPRRPAPSAYLTGGRFSARWSSSILLRSGSS